MPKVIFVGDLHIGDVASASSFDFEARTHYISKEKEVEKLFNTINESNPDLIICVGDVVDWFSNENLEKALSLFEILNAPWLISPGNHDFQLPPSKWALNNDGVMHKDADVSGYMAKAKAIKGWVSRGVQIQNQVFKLGAKTFLLVDSSCDKIEEPSLIWLENEMKLPGQYVIVTHVPLKTPQAVASYERNKNRKENDVLVPISGRLQQICRRIEMLVCGHVHFRDTLTEPFRTEMLNVACLNGEESPHSGFFLYEY